MRHIHGFGDFGADGAGTVSEEQYGRCLELCGRNIANMESELCSVIMPAYNSEKYIAKAIESVLSQTYENIELLIVDDCSTDRTKDIIHSYAKLDSRIRLISNEHNIGCAESRNRAIGDSKGDYIAFLDSDDIWELGKIALQIQTIRHMSCDAVYTSYQMIDSIDRQISIIKSPPKVLLGDMLKNNEICFSSVLMKSEVAKQYKMIPDYFHEDYCYWICLLREGVKFVGVSDVLVKYRVSNQGRSANKYNAAVYRWKIYREYLGMNYIESCMYFLMYMFYGILKHYFSRGKYD